MSGRTLTGPIHVVHVFNAVRHSGAERSVLAALDEFGRLGIRLSLLAMATPEESTLASAYLERGVPVDHLAPRSWSRFAVDYLRHLHRVRPDVVHVHPERASVLTSILPRLLGIPVVRSVHAGFDFPTGLRRRKTVERRLARWLGVRFVAVGSHPQANERAAFANPCACIVNWYDPDRFRLPSAEERAAARRQYALPEDARVVAVIGMCEDVKRHGLVFDAVALTAHPEQWYVLHAGTGTTEPIEHLHATRLGIDDRVRFLGLTDEVPTVLAAADVHAMTSQSEGLSIAALEALAVGVATVVTDVPGLRELERVAIGVTVTEADPLSLARAFDRGVDRDDAASKAERARVAAARFGLARGAAEYAAMYRGTRRVDPVA